jgi:hypothetical protein
MAERAKLKAAALSAAAADAGATTTSSSSSSRQRKGKTQPGVVEINSGSDTRAAAIRIAQQIQKRGWVELTCYGGPLSTQRGVEVCHWLIVETAAVDTNGKPVAVRHCQPRHHCMAFEAAVFVQEAGTEFLHIHSRLLGMSWLLWTA